MATVPLVPLPHSVGPGLMRSRLPKVLPLRPPIEVEVEAEGFRLHLSSRSSSGYKGVTYQLQSKRYVAVLPNGSYIGSFATALDAAVAYAQEQEHFSYARGTEETAAAPAGDESARAIADALGL